MLILDLCAGSGSATKAFKDRGHEVDTLTDLWGTFPFFWSRAKRKQPITWAYAHPNHIKYDQSRAAIPYGLSLALCESLEREYKDNKT
jgi:hypothetical protein